MRFKISALIALLCLATFFAYGQTRKTRKGAAKKSPVTKQGEQPLFEDVGDGFLAWYTDTLAFDHAFEGRGYYIYGAAYNATTDELKFAYVVKFDEGTPAGRSALNTARELAKNFAIYPDQLYYVGAMQYTCQVERKKNTFTCYWIDWDDYKGNTIAVCPSATFSAQVNQNFIDALLNDSHVNPEGRTLVLRLGDHAKDLWDKAWKAAKSPQGVR